MSLAFREAMRAFARAPMLSLLSVTTIAFSLFAFGVFGLVALNLRTQILAEIRSPQEHLPVCGPAVGITFEEISRFAPFS